MSDASLPATDSAPPESSNVDLERPSAARVYDYWLGGSHNTALDREVGERVAVSVPWSRPVALANRGLLRRVVSYLAACGVDQFLDLGSGIPTVGNVHEVARRFRPSARVVYVDVDRVAFQSARRMLGGDPAAVALLADLRDTESVIDQAANLLDLDRPVAVLAIAALHFVPDDAEAAAAVAAYRAAVSQGSYLAISHYYDPGDALSADDLAVYARTGTPAKSRSPEQLRRLLGDWSVVEPGVLPVSDWHPDSPPVPEHLDAGRRIYAGVAQRTLA